MSYTVSWKARFPQDLPPETICPRIGEETSIPGGIDILNILTDYLECNGFPRLWLAPEREAEAYWIMCFENEMTSLSVTLQYADRVLYLGVTAENLTLSMPRILHSLVSPAVPLEAMWIAMLIDRWVCSLGATIESTELSRFIFPVERRIERGQTNLGCGLTSWPVDSP